MLLTSIDPGKKTGGIAFFYNGKLVSADVISVGKLTSREEDYAKLFAQDVVHKLTVQCRALALPFGCPVDLVCEDQVVRTAAIVRGSHRANPQDLLWLSKTVGACEMALANYPCHRVVPETWKGTIDADILLKRLRDGRLFPEEEIIWDSLVVRYGKTSAHHAQDAVGIGLFQLGRIKRGGVV